MKSILATFWLLIIGTILCNAQAAEKTKLNAVLLELGKTGLIYNIVLDHKFKEKSFGIRVDIGLHTARYLTLLTTGAGGYYLVGKSKSVLELGIDVNYLSVNDVSEDVKEIPLVYPDYSVKTLYTSLNIGYRKYSDKTLFRIGISPGFIKSGFVPGGYISFGFMF